MTDASARDFRPGMDLDDFERRARGAGALRQGEDPLAELARLVGQQDDPFRNVFAKEHPLARKPEPVAVSAPPVAAVRPLAPVAPPVTPNAARTAPPRLENLDQDAFFQELTAGPREAPAAPAVTATVHPFPSARADHWEGVQAEPPLQDDWNAVSDHAAASRFDVPQFNEKAEAFDAPEASPQSVQEALPDLNGYELRPAPQDFDVQHDDWRHGPPAGPADQADDVYLREDRGYDPVLSNPGYMPSPEAEAEMPAPRRSRRMMVAAGVGGLAVVALGAGYFGLGGGMTSREPPTILAQSAPAKVEPPAQTERPLPASSVLERAGSSVPPSTNVVNRQEQPADLSAQARLNGTASGTQNGQTPASAASPFPEPKRVRTISVGPDGTILDGPDRAMMPPLQGNVPEVPPMVRPPVATGSTAPAATQTPAAGLPSTPLVPRVVQTTTVRAEPPPAAADPAKATARATTPPVRAAAPAPAPDRTATARIPASAPVGAPAQLPSAAPAATAPAPSRTASLFPDLSTSSTGAAPAPAASSGRGGDFAVQLAAPNTEAAARQTSASLRQRHAGLLGGKEIGVRRATVSGRDVYRVRVSNLSRDEATSLCSQLQASGASCFVARN